MDVRNKVFISYAHEDRDIAMDFYKHLAARLREEAAVWIDQGIRKGADWEAELTKALDFANCALLLLSVDFFDSDYIRQQELPRICEEMKRGLRVIPIVIRACPWDRQPQLCCLQFGLPADTPLLAIRDESRSKYESAVEQVCKIIADEVGQLGKQSSSRTRELGETLNIDGLEIKEAKQGGDYSVVYRGEKDGRAVAVKVMSGMRLEEYAVPFAAAASRAKQLDHPCFIPLLYSRIEAGSPQVLMLPWIDSIPLAKQNATKPLPIDKVATFLRRASEALSRLHDLGGIYGTITPDNVYVEEKLEMLKFPALSVFGFLSYQQQWNRSVGHKAEAPTYLLPEQYYGQPMSARSDQYALAQLALEMLCGGPPVAIRCPADLTKKREFFDSPAQFIATAFANATWPGDHPQFSAILFRMLRREPAERWPSLGDVVSELRQIEEESRTIAKATYMELKDDAGFFAGFYALLFQRCESAKQKFDGLDMSKQHEKLKASMIGMLNFREGAEPTTLSAYVPVHVERGVTAEELTGFERCLLECIEMRYGKHSKQALAWARLLPPVTDYMKKQCAVAH